MEWQWAKNKEIKMVAFSAVGCFYVAQKMTKERMVRIVLCGALKFVD